MRSQFGAYRKKAECSPVSSSLLRRRRKILRRSSPASPGPWRGPQSRRLRFRRRVEKATKARRRITSAP
ncbi:unnamed protein product [Lota lota]